jgi:hypothetical protein
MNLVARSASGAAPSVAGDTVSARLSLALGSPSRVGVVLVGVLVGLAVARGAFDSIDARTAWEAASWPQLYPVTWSVESTKYVYPPPLAEALSLFRFIPWPIFIVGWMTFLFATFGFVARRWALPLIALGAVYFALPEVLPPVTSTILGWLLIGNVQILLAAVTILGFRWPALWALATLTKVGPGIGLLWFALRREWWSLAQALLATAIIGLVSFIAWPGSWFEWVAFLQRNASAPSPVPIEPVPFVLRLAMSTALIAWGAMTNRRWTVPVAAGWASPQLYEYSYLVIWLAAIPLLADRHRRSTSSSSVRSLVARFRGNRSMSNADS